MLDIAAHPNDQNKFVDSWGEKTTVFFFVTFFSLFGEIRVIPTQFFPGGLRLKRKYTYTHTSLINPLVRFATESLNDTRITIIIINHVDNRLAV